MPERRGFTLIEVMIIIVIAGVLMLVAFPKMSQALVRANVNGARSAVASTFARARAAAVERGRGTRVRLTGNRLYVTSAPRLVPLSGSTLDTVGTVQNLNQQFGVTATLDNDDLGFDPRGFGTNTGTTTVSVTKSSYTKTLIISPFGRLKP